MRSFNILGTSLHVSKIGLGTASLHHSLVADRRRILKASLDGGITHIDTARLYGNGISESTIGNYLSSSVRESLTIATKVGFEVNRVQEFMPMTSKVFTVMRSRFLGPRPQVTNYSIEACERSLSASLKALKSDWVDILFLHEPLLATYEQIERLLPWFKLQQSMGKARYIGLAGDHLIGSELHKRFGSQFNIIQTNRVNDYSMPPQIQYGFFRDLSESQKSEVWRKVLRQDFDGMMLYSSKKPSRIDNLCKALSKQIGDDGDI